MHPALEAAALRRGGVFTVADARSAGYRPDEIRSAVGTGDWHRLRRGIYVSARTWAAVAGDARAKHLLDSVAVLTALGRGPVLSHSSAARFHDVVLPQGVDDVVRLTDPDQWRTGRGYRIAAATLPAGDVVRTGPFDVTSTARTLVDVAREWSLVDSVVAVDDAIFRKRVRRSDVRAAILRQSHWVGIGVAARVLGLSDGRAESPLESRGRLALLQAGLPRPELQVELHGPRGFVGRVDAWYEDAGVAIEFDGLVKYTDPRDGGAPSEVAWQEKRREDLIRDLDVRVVRVVHADLPRLGGPVARLRQLIAQPLGGPRRFTVVRRPEPGSDPEHAAA
ncbi:type IV toxin-antitoxin system AbiEi family antitoxin domain-containing protein [Blastococcus sp. PRF04-17]|uniref:type IV toxin-antitoxin system AbiEi family antitoxin domain-containing protein n=1 Tax=Blastococcus sp. PRF04-17 TaxID=2933797 RepID=UPI001FF4709A|nr:type IV toxin-antitoxin system AbiEi family antitoxin domain-containing protein [Blastococcus sp. PRF04-17]UOY00327.1 type IV toxin-antitoxin system AbiEi family antitoxin domain-containing protein [Blastococcus sp. PRF04-17]